MTTSITTECRFCGRHHHSFLLTVATMTWLSSPIGKLAAFTPTSRQTTNWQCFSGFMVLQCSHSGMWMYCNAVVTTPQPSVVIPQLMSHATCLLGKVAKGDAATCGFTLSVTVYLPSCLRPLCVRCLAYVHTPSMLRHSRLTVPSAGVRCACIRC